MGVEKQIQIEKKEGEVLDKDDRKNFRLINDFLLLNNSGDKEENESTIKSSTNEDVLLAWENLRSKFESRILFINSDPNPEDYLIKDNILSFDSNKKIERRSVLLRTDVKRISKYCEHYDKQIARLISNITSEAYLTKISNEFNSEEIAKKHIQTRVKNIINGDYRLIKSEASHFKHDDKIVYLNIYSDNIYVAIHEIGGHKSLQNNGGLSDLAKNILTRSFNKDFEGSSDGVGLFVNAGQYFGNLSERYSRKKVMDFEMEDLGIKTYSENFTEIHYNKIMELYEQSIKNIKEDKESILSKNTIEFIKTTKKDPKIYEEIFNNIA